jgi:WD40 repeat protein/beta-lactamase regulating signal transducer with metallopeptidase domain
MTSVETLNALGSGWASFMARALLDSSILLAAVVLVWLPLRRRMSAQFAHGLFLLVLLKLALPIPASWPSWSAEAPLKWAASGVSAWATADRNEVPIRPVSDPVDDPIVVASIPEPIVAAASVVEPKSDPSPEPARVAAPPTPVRTPLSSSAILMLVWLAVSAALFARLVRSIWVTRRLIRESLLVPEGLSWFTVDFETLRRTAGVRSAVRWALSAKVTSPAVGGLLRPTVVMPPDLDDGLTAKQLNWVLLHELAHIRRGDLWVVMVQRLVGAVFFFHPAVHLANWIIDQLREYACDDVALAAAHASRHACGEGFLTIVGRSVDHTYSPSPALGLFESRMLIHRRLLRILDSRRTIHPRLSPLATVVLVAMALVVLPYGRARDVAANLSISSASPVTHERASDEPRQFALGSTFLHDDRASSSGQPRLPVLAVAYSPDGRHLATAGEDKAIVIRDPATGLVRFRLEGHSDAVTSLAFSPDGSTLASGSYDTTVRLWDASTGKLRDTLRGHVQWIFALAFSPDGQTLASSGSDRTIRLWDVPTGRSSRTLSGPTSAIRALAFSPDGQTLASAGVDRVVTLWTWRTSARATFGMHRGTIRALAFSPEGQSLATAGEDGEVKLWDPKTRRERATLTGHSDMVFALAFSPTGSTLASAGLDSCVKLWDPKTGRERGTLAGHVDGVPALAFAPGARQLASTGYDGTVRLWEPAAPTLSAAATLDYPGEALGVAFAPDGKALHATGSASALATYDPIARLTVENALPGAGTRLAVAPDGNTAALGGLDGRVRLIDLATRQEVANFEAHAGEVRALAFGRGGKILATGGIDGKVYLHEIGSPSKRKAVPASGGSIADLRFTPGGETLAIATEGQAGEVALFDVDSAEPRGSLPGRGAEIASLAFSPDGRTIATIGLDGGIVLFDMATRSQRANWTYPEGKAIAFSPDGRFLATGHKGGDVMLWDSTSGVKLATLKGHSRAVSGVAFAPDGRTIASSGLDKTVRLWNLGARRITPRSSLNGDLACIGPVATSPDGKMLAAAEVAYDSAGHIALWDLARRTSVKLHGHDRGVASLAFSPDGTTLASSSWDLTTRLWDARTGEPRGEFATTVAVARLAFSPDGKTLAAAGEDKVLTFWDVEAGSELGRIDGFRGPIFAIAFSPDGRSIATGGGRDLRKDGFGEVKVFDVPSHEELGDFAGHTASVRSLAFSSDGSTLVTGGVDSTVRVWDVETGKPRLVLGGFPDCVRALGLSPDGRSLAVAARGDGVVSLLDASSGGEIARLVGHGGLVLGLTFSPDGRTLATGSLDASVKLWDVPATRTEIANR